jgi:hypothetical protein
MEESPGILPDFFKKPNYGCVSRSAPFFSPATPASSFLGRSDVMPVWDVRSALRSG